VPDAALRLAIGEIHPELRDIERFARFGVSRLDLADDPESFAAPVRAIEPGLRVDYHPTYYAAFVRDPDGNNLEAVCHTS